MASEASILRTQILLHHLLPVPSSSQPISPFQDISNKSYETIEVSYEGNSPQRVCLIKLNRPRQLNALSKQLQADIHSILTDLDKDGTVGCIVITGNDKVFAAGADIKELSVANFKNMQNLNFFDAFFLIKKPIIAAVAGIAFGGGCELAMACDIIIAADNAQFGQPEIKIGTIPGAGGTIRLPKAVGKSKAMEMVLTGDPINAADALKFNLVSKVVPVADLIPETMKIATKIARLSKPIVAIAKESVNTSYETTLKEGIHFERKVFFSTFATEDRKEGMEAFINKRKPNWKDE